MEEKKFDGGEPSTKKIKMDPINAEELQIVANNLRERSLLEQMPGEILKIIGDYAGLSEKKRLAECGSKALLRFFKDEIRPANAEFIAFLNPILHLNPNEVKTRLEARPDLVRPEKVELTKLLIHVVKGEITQAEAMLTANPDLLVAKGWVIDFSDRTFFGKGITVFQYALAAQDMPMTKMLLKHFPQAKNGEAAVASQYRELGEMLADKDENKHKALKNLNYSIDDLHKKLGAYIEKYSEMRAGEFEERIEEVKADWCKVVGGAQRKLPAWVILMMLEESMDNDLAWVQHDIDIPVKRYFQDLNWWFGDEYDGRLLGSSWAVVRGWQGGGLGWFDVVFDCPKIKFLEWDHEMLALCQSARPGELPTLESLYSSDVLVSAAIQAG